MSSAAFLFLHSRPSQLIKKIYFPPRLPIICPSICPEPDQNK